MTGDRMLSPRTSLLSVLVLLLAIAVPAEASAAYSTASGQLSPVNQAAHSGHKYLGRWNYVQPDRATGNNVAVLACSDGGTSCSHNPALPLPLKIPQVGWIDFSPGPDGTLYGRTDQGCVWNFAVTAGGLELSSKTQLCFNATIGQYYSIRQWSVQVDGDVEREQIISESFQPNGDVLFTEMNFSAKDQPSRRRVVDNGGDSVAEKLVGSFRYDPFSLETLDNITVTDRGSASPDIGEVRIDRLDGNRIAVHTPDGCSWILGVQGNTAELLDPGTQMCRIGSTTLSLRYWAIVTDDGGHLSAFRSGYTFENNLTNAYTFIGSLTRK
ncbi:MAG: hypothetical protein HOV77_19560 [Hamadaea sp.]|uniref:hypothetical protein n=1 Tax=Hamadaea sp. TaxID=2024425 RepID=UPI0017D3C292|nr:hypothetical protein [Hamadaea sp.]NUT21377.1 hypothetical protein [Hamadaea sp.]